jgi:TatA/E family protein of Tat protein translocase
MGSIGIPELILIFLLALLLFGPRKLPEIGRGLGKAMGEFRRASNDLKRTLEEEVETDRLRDLGREVRDSLRVTPPAGPQAPDGEAAVGTVDEQTDGYGDGPDRGDSEERE